MWKALASRTDSPRTVSTGTMYASKLCLICRIRAPTTYRPTNFSTNYPMMCWLSESMSSFPSSAQAYDADDVVSEYSHELYNYSVTLDMYLNFAPKFPGRYLSSNVNITVEHSNGSVVSVPVGSKW